MLVQKQSFRLQSYCLECGESIPVQLGYEAYGKLNKQKDNVILVCHYFSATSHAAGKYNEDDESPGWWDGLIGPNKAIDTNEYYVICMDNLSNVQWKNPMVITTGPASIHPKNGQPYGMSFPLFTFRDMVGIQKELLHMLGIERLHAVIGPSAGGMIAMHWAVAEPEMVARCIGVITNAQSPIITSFNVLQHAIRAIQLDPHWQEGNYYGRLEPLEGLHLAAQMMYTGAFGPEWYEKNFPRNSEERLPYTSLFAKTSYEQDMYDKVLGNIAYCDANHWLYACRATMLQDIAHGFSSLEEALQCIQAKVLLISCYEDFLQPAQYSEQTVQTLQHLGKIASFYGFGSPNGHMAGVLDTHLFEKQVRDWLKS
ncbi:alpha/beta fold hydrolase [Ectobacillus panaciterrae]|uniref:alpha/beta fold hydrolase n=1 Tax=Ectobacillus panaciterrae TaxID=363872 RepID=UPI00041948AF|nr:homoserine O-acetyltransferase [Ectobacillus panaciterrae]